MELTRRSFVGAAAAAATMGIASTALANSISESENARLEEETRAFNEAVGQLGDVPVYTDDELWAMLRDEAEVTEDYVLEDGTVVPAIYVRMRNRINRYGGGIGNFSRDGGYKWLMSEFSPEWAEFFMKMPLLKLFQVEEMVQATDMEYDECHEILEAMAQRGLIYRIFREGVPHYHQIAWVHGLFEFSQPYWIDDISTLTGTIQLAGTGVIDLYGQSTPVYHPIPVGKEVVGDKRILPFDDIEALVARNELIAMAPCQCRQSRQLLGILPETCDHPVETCMSFGECAQFYITTGVGKQITQEEALAIFQRSIDAGMVIQSEFTEHSEVVCSCHSDCCYQLGAIRAANGELPSMRYISNYRLELDKDTCIQCQACVARCPMSAVSMGEDGFPQMDNACVRCGQCALVCPADARKLWAVPEEDRLPLAEDMLGDYVQKAKERVARGLIVDFVG